MSVSSFDSKQRFLDAIRAAFGGGTFFLGDKVSSSTIQRYASYLQDDYNEQENAKLFFQAKYMGYQGNGYWIISNNVIMFKTFLVFLVYIKLSTV